MTPAREIMANLAVFHNGDWDKIYEVVQRKDYDKRLDGLSNGMNYITVFDEHFPEKLSQSYKQPFALFYKGNLDLLKSDKIISVISSREQSSEFHNIVDELLKGTNHTLIIGGNTASDMYISTICNKIIVVLPCGIDYKGEQTAIVDTVVSNGGLVLSEYPKDTPPNSNTFKARIRIMEGIATDTLAIEVKPMSSGLMRATLAVSIDNKVYAVPKSITDKTYINNELIYEGATPCYKRDVLDN